MKYIDADKLIAEIDRRMENYNATIEKYCGKRKSIKAERDSWKWAECKWFRDLITSLQQEQPEDTVIIAKTFLDALSKTPYNNRPITDAQIIVRQLLLFFENPKEYNPNAILEQPEVDLEEKLDAFLDKWDRNSNGSIFDENGNLVTIKTIKGVVKQFLNARKE